MKPLLIFGAGGHAKAVIATALASGVLPDLVAADGSREKSFLGIPFLPAEDVAHIEGGFRFIVAIGNSSIRRQRFDWLLSVGGEPLTLVHPRASVSEYVEIGRGSVIFALAHIDPCVSIGENCILNAGAMIGHDSIIGDDCHISVNACLGGGCHVGRGAWVSIGAAIKEGVRIGEESFVSLGAILSHDLPAKHKAISPHKREAIILPIG